MPPREPEFDEAHIEHLVVDMFRRAGWRVQREPSFGAFRLDFIVRKDDYAYGVEIKRSSEGRRDRLLPLLSQAILEAQAAARHASPQLRPLAIVCASHVRESAAAYLAQFARRNAPDAAVGIIDVEGFQLFIGPGLDAMNKSRDLVHRHSRPLAGLQRVDLFSAVNQWLLKVMLAPRIPESMLAAPRGEYRNASQLAEASNVSMMSAFRFVKQLDEEGFLESPGSALRLVRIRDLLKRWQSANSPAREVRMRWLIRNQDPGALYDAIRSCLLEPGRPSSRRSRRAGSSPSNLRPHPIRVCVGLFAAAELLGLGFVHGAPRHLYIEYPDAALLELLGLARAGEGDPVDVFVRIPIGRASIFRSAVNVNALPVSDVLQVWLDVGSHPARGSAQADEIWRRVLGPALDEK